MWKPHAFFSRIQKNWTILLGDQKVAQELSEKMSLFVHDKKFFKKKKSKRIEKIAKKNAILRCDVFSERNASEYSKVPIVACAERNMFHFWMDSLSLVETA